MNILRKFIRILKAPLLIVYVCLLLIHFIIKDRFFSISVVYYACPLPLIILLGLMVTVFFHRNKRVFYGLMLLLMGLNIYFFSHYFGTAATPKPNIPTSKLMFWNVAQKSPFPTDIIITNIQEHNPEAMAMVEAVISPEELKVLSTACPNYQFMKLYGTMLVAVKGSIDDVDFKPKTSVYKYNYIKATIDNKPFRMVIADVNAIPFSDKRIPLGIIQDISKKNEVDFLVGDFNTPYESVFFKPYKEDFNSFHPYSLGMSSTWPRRFPLIEIDQIWLDKKYHPISLQKECYSISDHKMLIAEFQK